MSKPKKAHKIDNVNAGEWSSNDKVYKDVAKAISLLDDLSTGNRFNFGDSKFAQECFKFANYLRDCAVATGMHFVYSGKKGIPNLIKLETYKKEYEDKVKEVNNV